MISRLLSLFRGSPDEPLRAIVDPVLGLCVPDQDAGWWQARVEVNGRKIAFTMAGDLAPDPALLAHAHRIVADLDAFEKSVAEFLRQAAAKVEVPELRAEIESLAIDDVSLTWPDRPLDGMIYFTGSSDERSWRCDYIDGQCRGLGCDT
jgi:hypothetical protein